MDRASVAVAGLVMAAVATGQPRESTARQPGPYLDAVVAYRHGDVDKAVDRLVGWSADELKRVASALADDRHDDWRLRAAAAMLHCEIILRGKASANAPVLLHLALAQRIVDKLDSADFTRRWYALAGSINLSRTDPGSASAYIDRGLLLFKNDARLRMLAGAIDEMRSHIADGNLHDREMVRLTPPGGRRTVMFAEINYRRAIDLDPKLDEARLRLGRVIFLRNDPNAARVELKRVARDSSLPRLRYLAHLFLGAVGEYQNDLTTARDEYREALVIGPGCQTPYIALAFVESALGHEGTARDLMARYAAVSVEASPDPWSFYQNGGIDEESLGWLRERVFQ
jgi:tetratricopeptide (TPR) repeat protein